MFWIDGLFVKKKVLYYLRVHYLLKDVAIFLCVD